MEGCYRQVSVCGRGVGVSKENSGSENYGLRKSRENPCCGGGKCVDSQGDTKGQSGGDSQVPLLYTRMRTPWITCTMSVGLQPCIISPEPASPGWPRPRGRSACPG